MCWINIFAVIWAWPPGGEEYMFQSFQSGKTTEGVDWSKDWSVVAGVDRNLFGLIKVSKSIGWNNLKQLGKHQALSQIF